MNKYECFIESGIQTVINYSFFERIIAVSLDIAVLFIWQNYINVEISNTAQ